MYWYAPAMLRGINARLHELQRAAMAHEARLDALDLAHEKCKCGHPVWMGDPGADKCHFCEVVIP